MNLRQQNSMTQISVFECDLCYNRIETERTHWSYGGSPAQLTVGYSPYYVGDGVYRHKHVDLCPKCFDRLCKYVKEQGGRIQNE